MKTIKFDSKRNMLISVEMETMNPDYQGSLQTFEEINQHLGSRTIALFTTFEGIDLYVDDEGLLTENLVYQLHNKQYPELDGLYFAGDILFLGSDEETGESLHLTQEQSGYIINELEFELYGMTNV